MVQRVKDSGVVVRSWDFDRLEEEGEAFTALVNETFSAHWGLCRYRMKSCARFMLISKTS
jgi:hypothetical protein